MRHNYFTVPFERLPRALPVFPLPGTIVLPGTELPLNVFEPRYLNMVADALGGSRLIGIVQPDPDSVGDDRRLCRTGCAGRITQYREVPEGRIEVVLSGVCRFDLGEELPTVRGYRLVVPGWERFAADYQDAEPDLGDRRAMLMRRLRRYFEARGIEVDWTRLMQLPTVRLVDSLSVALPFDAAQKQALLESVAPATRLAAFDACLEAHLQTADSAVRH